MDCNVNRVVYFRPIIDRVGSLVIHWLFQQFHIDIFGKVHILGSSFCSGSTRVDVELQLADGSKMEHTP